MLLEGYVMVPLYLCCLLTVGVVLVLFNNSGVTNTEAEALILTSTYT